MANPIALQAIRAALAKAKSKKDAPKEDRLAIALDDLFSSDTSPEDRKAAFRAAVQFAGDED